MKVLDNRAIQGTCSCGWKGNVLSTANDLSLAMAAAQSEIQAHKHISKPKKEK